MRQTADREKKEEADLTATMGKVDKEVGGHGRRLGCPTCCTGTVAEAGCLWFGRLTQPGLRLLLMHFGAAGACRAPASKLCQVPASLAEALGV
jgi:hypothetical protein